MVGLYRVRLKVRARIRGLLCRTKMIFSTLGVGKLWKNDLHCLRIYFTPVNVLPHTAASMEQHLGMTDEPLCNR